MVVLYFVVLLTMWLCSMCELECDHVQYLIRHYKLKHSHEPGFSLHCVVNNCFKLYKSIRCMVRHIQNKHRLFYAEHLQAHLVPDVNNPHDSDISDADENANGGHEQVDRAPAQAEDLKGMIANLLLNLRENHKLPSSSLQYVTSNLQDVLDMHTEHILTSVQGSLVDIQMNIDDKKKITDAITNASPLNDILSQLSSQSSLEKYASESMEYVAPLEIVLGNHGRQSHTYQYVPILRTLKTLLGHEDVFTQVMNDHSSENNELLDICDGSAFKENGLFSTEQHALQLILYLDDFNVVNPLGNKTKEYKLCAFYMVLGNLHSKYRSKLNMIQLVLLCKTKHIKQYGMPAILEPLIRDLITLEDIGLTIVKDDGQHIFRGSISVVIGDNLASHSIGGFMESFTTSRFCRYCPMTRNNLQNLPIDVDQMRMVQLRTCRDYDTLVSRVEHHAAFTKIYGIKARSCLNQLSFFHVVNGLPPDLGNDIFEGVANEVLACVIVYCVSEGYYSLDILNSRVQEYEYKHHDKQNRPGPISGTLNNFKLKQTFSEMWCLVRLFPLIIGELVPRDDPKWNVYLTLLSANEMICAPSFRRGHVSALDDILQEFFLAFAREFPDKTWKSHYPSMILKYGPLIHTWTLRFEAKHSYFKSLFSLIKCHKNIALTLATRHQYQQALIHKKSVYLQGSNSLEVLKGKEVAIHMLELAEQHVLRPVMQNTGRLFVWRACGVRYNSSTTFASGTCVIVGKNGDLFKFKQIKICFIIAEVPYICVRDLETLHFDSHFNCYVVEESADISLIRIDELQYPQVLSLYSIPESGYKCVVLKSYIFD